MKEKSDYQPSSAEIQDAENRLTRAQKRMSVRREDNEDNIDLAKDITNDVDMFQTPGRYRIVLRGHKVEFTLPDATPAKPIPRLANNMIMSVKIDGISLSKVQEGRFLKKFGALLYSQVQDMSDKKEVQKELENEAFEFARATMEDTLKDLGV